MGPVRSEPHAPAGPPPSRVWRLSMRFPLSYSMTASSAVKPPREFSFTWMHT